jgi:predicted ATPase
MVDHSLADPVRARTDQLLVGRTSELAEIDRFLDRSRNGLGGLLLSGPAGIGKTTLWKAALSRATEQGYRVLACRPTEVETQLFFAALVDLLDGVADQFLPQLPEPQRVAVEAALLRGTTEAAPAPLGVSLGVLGILRVARGGRAHLDRDRRRPVAR